MSAEIHRADWTLHYPKRCDEPGVTGVLRLSTQVEHNWDAFPWYLTGSLVGLLEQPTPTFAYYNVTAYFVARAAMLALTGCVLDRKELLGAFCRHRVQAGGIYREHLLRCLRTFLKKHDLVQLPACEANHFDPLRDAGRAEANRTLVQQVLMLAEGYYVNALNFVSLATELSEMLGGDSLEFLVKGGNMPAAVGAPLRIHHHADGHDISPSREEAKAAIQACWQMKPILVRPQGEFVGMREREECGDLKPESRGKAEGGDLRPESAGRGRKSGEKGNEERRETREKKTGFEVIGDYRVIRIPGRREISLARKHKTRAVLRFIHMTLKKAGTTNFYVDDMRVEFNAQFGDDIAGKRWMSDRFREDLFKGKLEAFDLLFEPLDRASGHYRMKFCGWLAMLGLGALGNLGDGSWLLVDGGVWDWVQWGVGELRMWA